MATRIITGTIYHPGGNTPFASGIIKFRNRHMFTAGGVVYPDDTTTIIADSAGQFTTTIAVPDTGVAGYDITFPTVVIPVNIAAGPPTTLAELIAVQAPAVSPNAIQEILDANRAAVAAEITEAIAAAFAAYTAAHTRPIWE